METALLDKLSQDLEVRYILTNPATRPHTDAQHLIDRIQGNMKEAWDFHRSLANYKPTPLVDLGRINGIGKVFVKDEGSRLGQKAFKVLGGTYAVHKLAQQGLLKEGDTLTTMTDGNHGVGVAYAAQQGGYKAVIFVPRCMKQERRDRITRLGARIEEVAGDYDEAIKAVRAAAKQNKWTLVADTAWEGYEEIPLDITTAYCTLFHEALLELRAAHHTAPTHILLQAGVGSFAAAGVAYALAAPRGVNMTTRDVTMTTQHTPPSLVCVEPCDADCFMENVKMSEDGNLPCLGKTESVMAGLNCGVPARTAWPILRDCCSAFVALGDGWPIAAVRELWDKGVVAGESGCAGYAALLAAQDKEPLRTGLGLNNEAVVLVVNTEGATDAAFYNQIVGKQVARYM